jgi:hypothetical protein
MTCSCKCCCGCCCDGATGSQSLEPPCTSPKVFHGKGTICDVCCDLGEIREDIDSEEDCPGTWVVNGRCLENPCGCVACDEFTPCPANFHCCEECCELGGYGADEEVIGGIAISTPNTAKGAYRTGFASGCNRVSAPGVSPFPLASNSIQICNVSEGCPEGYVETTSQVRIYDTDGNILAERGSICVPSEVAADPCADNPAP